MVISSRIEGWIVTMDPPEAHQDQPFHSCYLGHQVTDHASNPGSCRTWYIWGRQLEQVASNRQGFAREHRAKRYMITAHSTLAVPDGAGGPVGGMNKVILNVQLLVGLSWMSSSTRTNGEYIYISSVSRILPEGYAVCWVFHSFN